jgi:hypothetical protein
MKRKLIIVAMVLLCQNASAMFKCAWGLRLISFGFLSPSKSTGKIKVRMHRGGLKESLATTVEIAPTKEALAAVISTSLEMDVSPSQIHVEPYGFDKRIGWDTYSIKVDGFGFYGFSDGPIPPK